MQSFQEYLTSTQRTLDLFQQSMNQALPAPRSERELRIREFQRDIKNLRLTRDEAQQELDGVEEAFARFLLGGAL